jgi:hypothetical protein
MAAQDDYLRPLNPAAADQEPRGAIIATYPALGRAIPGTSLRYHVTRRYHYRIICRSALDTVEILDILHPRQASSPA